MLRMQPSCRIECYGAEAKRVVVLWQWGRVVSLKKERRHALCYPFRL